MTTAVYYRGVLAIDSRRTRDVESDLRSMVQPSPDAINKAMTFVNEYTGEPVHLPDADTTIATCTVQKLRLIGTRNQHGIAAIAASGPVRILDAIAGGIRTTIATYLAGVGDTPLSTSVMWDALQKRIAEYITTYAASVLATRAVLNAGHMQHRTWGMLIAGVDGAMLLRGSPNGSVRIRHIPTDHPYPVIIGMGDDLVRYFMAHRGIFDDTKTAVPIAARMVAVCGHIFPNHVGGDTSYIDTTTIDSKMQVFTEADAAMYVASLQMVTLDPQPEKA